MDSDPNASHLMTRETAAKTAKRLKKPHFIVAQHLVAQRLTSHVAKECEALADGLPSNRWGQQTVPPQVGWDRRPAARCGGRTKHVPFFLTKKQRKHVYTSTVTFLFSAFANTQ